jgi:RNA polymerase sigma-70 factor, ECF subfamily
MCLSTRRFRVGKSKVHPKTHIATDGGCELSKQRAFLWKHDVAQFLVRCARRIRSVFDWRRRRRLPFGRAPQHKQSNHSNMCTSGVPSLTNLLPGMLPRLRAFSLRLCGNQHDAEDLLQGACLRGIERAHQLQPDTAPLSWMFSIVQSIWINELRARNVRSRSTLEWNDNFLRTVPDPVAYSLEDGLLNDEIMAAVERLPEAQRTVLRLVGLEGLRYAEAAEMLDVPIGTIMSRLSRARKTITAQFDDRDVVTRCAGINNDKVS